MRLKKKIFMAALVLISGCASRNIKIPEEHMAPKEAKKGDSYIFLDSLKHNGNISKVGETEEGKNLLKVVFSTRENDVEKLNLYYEDGELKKKTLDSVGSYRGTEYYIAEIETSAGELEYFFEAKDGRVRYFLGETGGYSPKDIERLSYEVQENGVLQVPQWSKNTVWYGIYVDTFKNSDEDNDPIFNEMGPEYFFQPRGRLSDGQYKSDLIERGVWRSVDALGEFEVSDWTGDFSEKEAYERNLVSKYSEEAGRNTRRYGGDLQGVQEKLSYLKTMGVGVINLSPVFYSYSSHKEDTIDYRHISPDLAQVKTRGRSEYQLLDIDPETGRNNLGESLDSSTWKMTDSDKLMKKLTEDAHNKGMKVVLDVNISYVSKRFWALKSMVLQGKESPYRDWFFVDNRWDERVPYKGTSTVGVVTDEDGNRYRPSWIELPKGAGPEVKEEIYRWNLEHMGVAAHDVDGNMIKVNYSNEEFRGYLVDSLRKWTELGVDGYRIETGDAPEVFMEELKKGLLDINEEVLLIRAWKREETLEDSYFHGKDNFALGSIVVNFLDSEKKLPKDYFENAFYIYSRLNTLDSLYASPLYLDSKDTDRVFSMMINPGRQYDSLNMPENGYMNLRPDLMDRRSVDRVKAASLIQLTMAGSPYIYYGSEAGMWGGDAPYSRKPMLWSDGGNAVERDRYETYEASGKLEINRVRYNRVRKYVEYPVERNSQINTHYRRILEFRRKNPDIFRDGRVRFLEVRDEDSGEVVEDVLAYERILDEKRVVVVVNRGTRSKKIGVYTDGRGEFTSLMGSSRVRVMGKRLKLDIGPLEGLVYYN